MPLVSPFFHLQKRLVRPGLVFLEARHQKFAGQVFFRGTKGKKPKHFDPPV